MDYQTLKYEIDDGLLLLTLNRPENLNAFTVQMANELVAAYERASVDDAVRVIVVTGAGKAFCAGMDLSTGGNVFGLDDSQSPTLQDMRERLDDPAIHCGVRDTGGRVALAMFACRKPIVGAINGAAVGIGATMTLPMDFRFASEKARIGFVFGRLGITPEACSTWFLPRIVGLEQALEWMYSAAIFDAAEALDKKLVRAVCAPEQAARGSLCLRPHAGHRPLAGQRRADPADAVPQQRRALTAGGASPRLAGDVLHQHRRRQGGRAGLPREAPAAILGAGIRDAALLRAVAGRACLNSPKRVCAA